LTWIKKPLWHLTIDQDGLPLIDCLATDKEMENLIAPYEHRLVFLAALFRDPDQHTMTCANEVEISWTKRQ
jgi:hypothetical protein